MELFRRRPLGFLCFLFSLVSLIVFSWNGMWLLFGIGIGVLLMIGAAVGIGMSRKQHVRFWSLLLCFAAVTVAMLHSLLWIALPRSKAEAYVGERTVLCYVIAKEDDSRWGEEYSVKIKRIDGEKVNIRATLQGNWQTEFLPGDEVYLPAQLELVTQKNAKGIVLTAYASDADAGLVRRTSEKIAGWSVLFTESGIRILSNRLRQFLGNRLKNLLGDEIGALASGFFMGETSNISAEISRDFRRTGTSHQMAVSGLHVTILLGSLDFLLRKLYIPKRIRCVLIALLSGGFLLLTGFSSSACRAVLMLLAVYIGYWFYEDSDSVTILFVSLAIILLISPSSVMDLGLWMSCLATLGLLTLYAHWEEKIPYPRGKNPIFRRLLRWLRSGLLALLMTVAANLFLLPISWYFFREISLVSLICNLVLSPLASCFLISIPLLLIFSEIPGLGTLIGRCVFAIGTGIVKIIRFFSGFPKATISLKYSFAAVIVMILTVVMVILLLIRLRKKWLLILPPVAATLAFFLCFAVFHGIHADPQIIYRADTRQNEWLMVQEGDKLSVCDISSGGNSAYYAWTDELDRSVSTEIDTLLLTHYHKNHIQSLRSLLQNTWVRTLYLPRPENAEQAEYGKEIWEMGNLYGTKIVFYGEEDFVSFNRSVRVHITKVSVQEHESWLLSLYTSSDMLTYLSTELASSAERLLWQERLQNSSLILIGNHDSSESLLPYEEVWYQKIPVYVAKHTENGIRQTVTFP